MVQKHATDVILIITILCIVKSFSLPLTYPSVTLESAPLHHTHHNRKQNNSQKSLTTIDPKHKEFLLSRGWGESSGFPFLVVYSNYARSKQHRLEQQQKQEQQEIEQQKQELERQQRKQHSEKPINKINPKIQRKYINDGHSKQNLNLPIFVSNSWGPLGK